MASMSYDTFVNQELILFSMADNQVCVYLPAYTRTVAHSKALDSHYIATYIHTYIHTYSAPSPASWTVSSPLSARSYSPASNATSRRRSKWPNWLVMSPSIPPIITARLVSTVRTYHTYIPTYIPIYILSPSIPPIITARLVSTVHTYHTYVHAYIHTYIYSYQHTSIQ